MASTTRASPSPGACPDTPTALSLDEVLDHLADLMGATDLPVNADRGRLCTTDRRRGGRQRDPLPSGAGVAGLSIEDATGRPMPRCSIWAKPPSVSALLICHPRRFCNGVVPTARAESFLVGIDEPLADVLERLAAYARAGAYLLFAPGLRTLEDIRVVVEAAGTTPVNVLIGWAGGPERGRAGRRRRASGARIRPAAAGGAFLGAAEALRHGSFDGLTEAAPFARLNSLFGDLAEASVGSALRRIGFRPGDAAGQARDPDLAVLLEGAHLVHGQGPSRFRAGLSSCRIAAETSETCSLIISQYCSAELVTSSTATSHSTTSVRPAGPCTGR